MPISAKKCHFNGAKYQRAIAAPQLHWPAPAEFRRILYQMTIGPGILAVVSSVDVRDDWPVDANKETFEARRPIRKRSIESISR